MDEASKIVPLKIKPTDAHDRYTHFTRQDFSISDCCQDLVDKRPFGNHAFYIFAHARTDDDGVTKRLVWQPRLTKPKAQTNSMLFKAYPGTDIIKVIWMIPDRVLWPQFQKGKITASQTITESIHDFENNRKKLEDKEEDDLSDEAIDAIYRQMGNQARRNRNKASGKITIL